jgi:hypothetical protein
VPLADTALGDTALAAAALTAAMVATRSSTESPEPPQAAMAKHERLIATGENLIACCMEGFCECAQAAARIGFTSRL